ncbi:MAG: NADP-dependent isocitrate dehydrogenase [Candidatus Krumholzibacteria bacterium]|jgi:isocitrate dehydrogenase|nr:NADP-dependent isocitrate dehydrogenase [Candidatus Krumholzibacteria bacterium]MDP6797897.1 NADP-dependent isocitrate dehydrogenase [Candidatus Krumholzibacteria bacterium]
MASSKIMWTIVDEAPALASFSLLPLLRAFTQGTGIEIETRNISLAGRICALFPERLPEEQQVPDDLAELGKLTQSDEANIVKLPNISATVPQLQDAIRELQSHGYDIPDYPEEVHSEEDRELRERFSRVLGSAVNPVLREGNSDRRAAISVKKFAQKNPHRMMKDWPESGSKSRVGHMKEKDFFASEKSHTLVGDCRCSILYTDKEGKSSTVREDLNLLDGEVIDSSTMNVAALRAYFAEEMEAAREEGLLLSLHLKATMMKVSDPIMFGHCVSVYYQEALAKHADALEEAGVNLNNGLADLFEKIQKLPEERREAIEKDIEAVYQTRPPLAMVDSRKGITNLHVPNNIIIDASMPNVVRDGGKMWNRADELQDTLALIPDRCYATMYQEIIEDAQRNGQFDPSTMGSVSNVGLMAKKAEEYGSHDKTFEAPADGHFRVMDEQGEVVLEQAMESGDIFRMCQTRDESIRDWVKLAVRRARDSQTPAVFWLDEARGHDAELIRKLKTYLSEHDTEGLEIHILSPKDAMRFSLERIRRGENTIAVTGNVLRDYLTDLFPILELGTSARMLSIVPLLKGGGLFETGAGGSAPKHVQQFLSEGHLRWDSLGEYCALVPSLELIARRGNGKAGVLASTLDQAIGTYLEMEKTPSRKVQELDNRGSSFYLALYWAQALAAQDEDAELKGRFLKVSEELTRQEELIASELLSAQGQAQDIGGYFQPDAGLAERAMRPSATLNAIIDALL